MYDFYIIKDQKNADHIFELEDSWQKASSQCWLTQAYGVDLGHVTLHGTSSKAKRWFSAAICS